MKIKYALRLSYLAIIAIFLLQSCDEDKSSFGKDLEVLIVPTELSYTEIINAREFSYIESTTPFVNSNGHLVHYELISIKKDGEILDDSYMNSVTMLGFTNIEIQDPDIPDVQDVSENGKITIADGNPFGNGDYYFTVKAAVVKNAKWEYTTFEDALHLNIGPGLVEGISFCPNKQNFVSGETAVSDGPTVFGGNPDFRFELGSESDKLTIDPITGAISANPSYAISATEYLSPIINAVSNVSEEVVSFENAFTAVLSAAPVTLEKEVNYFFYPTLAVKNKKDASQGGNGYTRQVVNNLFLAWIYKNNVWKQAAAPTNSTAAVAARADAGVTGQKGLLHPVWSTSMQHVFDTWVIAEEQSLTPFNGCYDTKVVFWYKLNITGDPIMYLPNGEAPMELEVHISENYTGDVTSTNWTQINDLLTCEIADNGTEFLGTPYPGDQTGADPDNRKDLNKNANNLWVKCEMDLVDYLSSSSFTIAFRLNKPVSDAVNGIAEISDLHFVASEK